MYNTGTVTTTANSTKLVGTNTKWLNNINRVSAEQAIQIQIGTTVHNNSIQSIQSDTELTLNFPIPTAATGAKYVILTTMVHSVSDAVNKIVSMNVSNVQFSDILTRWMTEQGIITVTLPDQTTQQLRTTKEMDKQLDGKFDKTGGTISGDVTFSKNAIKSTKGTHTLPAGSGTLMQVGDYGWGAGAKSSSNWNEIKENGVYVAASSSQPELPEAMNFLMVLHIQSGWTASQIAFRSNREITSTWRRSKDTFGWGEWYKFYTEANTTKDSNGNLKAASPIVKVFADDIELNEESEGVEMEHLGIGHYLIKGVVGFNADGAWGINNGFVIPQDHNGKNMVLIDYEVRPDGDIEVFVFHQQNADMPERFQNKRIKHFDEGGMPVYFENYEPCDVPESRWIDMRVEMPSNSIYNQKQAEAERLAKIEAERLAQEEAKRAAEEAERAEQEAAEQAEEQ
ncbi:pyocin knob domain-containing protein [Providencia hangzhouensis]|uniref:pyocin knob domain-containing protein n=1 Tax=Providencia hangzhouensis TaxID=3031799 RepID=UPI003F4C5532